MKPLSDDRTISKFRNIVYYITFVSYALSHFSRKTYTNVKVQLKADAGFDPIMMGDDALRCELLS